MPILAALPAYRPRRIRSVHFFCSITFPPELVNNTQIYKYSSKGIIFLQKKEGRLKKASNWVIDN
ncbi:hypothetical protein BBV17_29385 [Cytobacillus oceanisediminis]|uniref:Uncharacterized protein n=1 Tax=Cytobacillus oceanisediminis TaxID=665099 RepID=A0ABX3CJI0_9BACI|nr:hypothetical protein BBV17_29385 [Cytobacillus oceanisediminis]